MTFKSVSLFEKSMFRENGKNIKAYSGIDEIFGLSSCDNVAADDLEIRVVLLDVADHVLQKRTN
jgi:hypothetical protein